MHNMRRFILALILGYLSLEIAGVTANEGEDVDFAIAAVTLSPPGLLRGLQSLLLLRLMVLLSLYTLLLCEIAKWSRSSSLVLLLS